MLAINYGCVDGGDSGFELPRLQTGSVFDEKPGFSTILNCMHEDYSRTYVSDDEARQYGKYCDDDDQDLCRGEKVRCCLGKLPSLLLQVLQIAWIDLCFAYIYSLQSSFENLGIYQGGHLLRRQLEGRHD